jgi:DNA-binding transcriptional MerR regulator
VLSYEDDVLRIGELATKSGLSAHTIRYYERIGLLLYAFRDQSGHRDYSAEILIWIEFLNRLKTTGMPVREMLRYAKLRERGEETDAERCDLLVEHRQNVRARIGDLQNNLRMLDIKIASYGTPDEEDKINDNHPNRRGNEI